jgi:hypothetical protein
VSKPKENIVGHKKEKAFSLGGWLVQHSHFRLVYAQTTQLFVLSAKNVSTYVK